MRRGHHRPHGSHRHATAHHRETWSSHWGWTLGHGCSSTHRHCARQQHHRGSARVRHDVRQGLIVVCDEHLAHEGVRHLGGGCDLKNQPRLSMAYNTTLSNRDKGEARHNLHQQTNDRQTRQEVCNCVLHMHTLHTGSIPLKIIKPKSRPFEQISCAIEAGLIEPPSYS